MRICDICGKICKEYKLTFIITDPENVYKDLGGIYDIDLCTKCRENLTTINIIDLIRLSINESKIQEILNHFHQSAQQTYTKENIIQIIKDIANGA